MFPDTGIAVVTLLRRLGVDVEFPPAQTCCAQPMVNTGYLDEAVPVVRTFVDAFAGYDAVVTTAAPVLDRRADEPLHLHVVRRHARRRIAGGPRRPVRQRPHARSGRRRRSPGAALHPLLGLPHRLSGRRPVVSARDEILADEVARALAGAKAVVPAGLDLEVESAAVDAGHSAAQLDLLEAVVTHAR